MFGATLLSFSLGLVHSLGFKYKHSLRYKMRNKAMKQTDKSGPWQLGHTVLESSSFSFSMYFFQVTISSKYFQDWFNGLWKWPILKISHIFFSLLFPSCFPVPFLWVIASLRRITVGTYCGASISLTFQLTKYWCVYTFVWEKHTSLCSKTYTTKFSVLPQPLTQLTVLWVSTLKSSLCAEEHGPFQ